MQHRQHGRDAGHLSIFKRSHIQTLTASRPTRRAFLHRMSRRLPRHAVERVEQLFAPRMDRIIVGEQFERTDHAGPLESTEHDVVGIIRRGAADQARMMRWNIRAGYFTTAAVWPNNSLRSSSVRIAG